MTDGKKSSILNFSIASDLKDESKEVLAKYNLDHSKAIRLFLSYVAEKGQLPESINEYLIEQKANK